LEKPFEGIETGVNILSIKMLLQFREELAKNFIMLLLETKKFWKTRNEKA